MAEVPTSAKGCAAGPFGPVVSLLFGVVHADHFLVRLAATNPVTFQTFSERETLKVKLQSGKLYDPNARILHGTLARHQRMLEQLNRQGAGVFVMVNTGDGLGRSVQSVQEVRALFIDTDGKPLPKKPQLQPHVVVQSSPGKYHVYWRVDGLELADFAPLQKALAEHYGTDPSVHDLPRVMRLPGFYHCKGEPVRVELLVASDQPPYGREEVPSAWPFLRERLAQEKAAQMQSERKREEAGARAEARRLNPPTEGKADQERKRALAVLEKHCKTVERTGEGGRNDTLYKAAYTLGGYVTGGYLETDEVTDALLNAATLCGLPALEAGALIPRALKLGMERPLVLSENAAEEGHLSFTTKQSKRARLAGWYA